MTPNLPRGCIKMKAFVLTTLEFVSLTLTLVRGPAAASYVGPIGQRPPRRQCFKLFQEHRTCVSIRCPFDDTCDTYGRYCGTDCEGRPGCFCKEGYVMHDDTCIPVDRCPSGSIEPCREKNEVFRRCVSSSCPKGPTCEHPEKYCGNCDSSPTCVCANGYLRHKQRGCVRPKDCEKLEIICPGGMCQGLHEEMRCVTNLCPKGPTCARPRCKDLTCEHRACACKLGYLRDRRGHCIRKTRCLEEGRYSEFGYPAWCGRMYEIYSCTSDRCPHGAECGKPWCPGKCMKGACVCIPDYARDSKGNCIKEEYCGKQG
ncbi:unnamed protein product, partial [Ixodes hexagonus]